MSQATKVFESLGILSIAASSLRKRGLEDEALGLDLVADSLLDDAVEDGLDYELETDELLGPADPEDAMDAVEDLEDTLDFAKDKVEEIEQAILGPEGYEQEEMEEGELPPFEKSIQSTFVLGDARARKWLCCGPVEQRRTRKGKRLWVAVCTYKSPQGPRSMLRIVGRNPRVKPKFVQLGGKRLRFSEDIESELLAMTNLSAAPVGVAQTALYELIQQLPEGQKVYLADFTRRPSLRGVHFKQVMSAAEALAKQKLIGYDHSGPTVWKI